MQRYEFFAIFGINPGNGDIYPLYNTSVNGSYHAQNVTIARGLGFGGINIYQLVGRAFGGTWDNQARILTLTTLF